MGAAEELPVGFAAMPDDPAPAMRARGRERVNRALETVERIRPTSEPKLEGLVVFVPAVVADSHDPA
jgi:hypothetical protein